MNDEVPENEHDRQSSFVKEFESKTPIGDLNFLVRAWPSWLVNPSLKAIAPVTRLSIASARGEIVFSRSVVLGGTFDLATELLETMENEVQLISEMDGFHIYVPEQKADFINWLDRMESSLDSIRKNMENIDVRSASEDAAEEKMKS